MFISYVDSSIYYYMAHYNGYINYSGDINYNEYILDNGYINYKR